MPKEPLNPLIPLEDLKKVIQGLVAVPKAEVDKAQAERPKSKRGRKPKVI